MVQIVTISVYIPYCEAAKYTWVNFLAKLDNTCLARLPRNNLGIRYEIGQILRKITFICTGLSAIPCFLTDLKLVVLTTTVQIFQ